MAPSEAPGLKKVTPKGGSSKGLDSSRGTKKKSGEAKLPKKKADNNKPDTIAESGDSAAPAPATPLAGLEDAATAETPVAIHIDISSVLQSDLEALTAENENLRSQVLRLTTELEALRARGEAPEVS